MSSSLIEHEQIVTTLPKAKELKPFMDKLVTLAKKGDLNSRRLAIARTRNVEMSKKLFDVLGPRYKDRSGGYVRVLKAGFRHGDNAPMAVIELVDRDEKPALCGGFFIAKERVGRPLPPYHTCIEADKMACTS